MQFGLDIDGAAANGVPGIAVTYGYGSGEEFSRAVATVDSPPQLVPTIVDLVAETR